MYFILVLAFIVALSLVMLLVVLVTCLCCPNKCIIRYFEVVGIEGKLKKEGAREKGEGRVLESGHVLVNFIAVYCWDSLLLVHLFLCLNYQLNS